MWPLTEFYNKNVLVVGIARSGVGAANLLHTLGSNVTINDIKDSNELEQYSSNLHTDIKKVFGSHPKELFNQADVIVLSPGVPLSIPAVQEAISNGKQIISELELAYRVLQYFGRPKFYAITGSNGKSTTTSLLYEIFNSSGMKVLVGGNIGKALTAELHNLRPFNVNGLHCPDYIVAELSSFQLETIDTFKPNASAILNISSDHQDRYHAMQPYIDAKCKIFLNQSKEDLLILNKDDDSTAYIASKANNVRVSYFSRQAKTNGVWYINGHIYANEGDFAFKVSEMALKGVHNIENAMVAIAMALEAGCGYDAIKNTLCTFKGLEHRLEFVKEINGITFINDSKGTNTGAVIKSLEGFDTPVILIAGGRDKDSDFSLLLPQIKRCVKAVVLIGEAAEKIANAFNGHTEIHFASSLNEAVYRAYKLAKFGDTVLLSPACASFDMFRDFEDRGRQFKQIVKDIC